MKKVTFVSYFLLASACLYSITSCNKLAGLPLQTDPTHTTNVLNPNQGITAWQYIKNRAIAGDSVFYNMYQGIIYSHIDTNEYIQPNRTFIVYHNNGVLNISTTSGKASTSSYFGKYKVLVGGKLVAASSWSQYDTLKVKNHLLSMIVKGVHSFNNFTLTPEFDTTLMPNNYDTLNPQSLIAFCLSDPRNSYLYINSFPGSKYPAVSSTTPNLPGLKVRTGGVVTTNGVVHVIDKVLFFQRQ